LQTLLDKNKRYEDDYIQYHHILKSLPKTCSGPDPLISCSPQVGKVMNVVKWM